MTTHAAPTDENPSDPDLLAAVVAIACAYLANNSVPPTAVAALIGTVHSALASLSAGSGPSEQAKESPKEPAVPIKKSVTNEYVICLEDGKKFRSLKRHLGTAYKMTPEQYRAKWGLPSDYPMVAPGYSAIRSRLAKDIGLGNRLGVETRDLTPTGAREAA